jgi:hypothetical protein
MLMADRTPDSDREAAIRARLGAATPGEWHVVDNEDCLGIHGPNGEWVGDVAFTDSDKNLELADAELIANAPEDLRYLLTALSEARASLAAAEAVTPLEWAQVRNANDELTDKWMTATWETGWTIYRNSGGYRLTHPWLEWVPATTVEAITASCPTLQSAQRLAARLDAVLREEGA